MQSYFSHDSNARNDEKILALRMQYGAEGYGVYFMILERLREATDYMSVKVYNSIAFDLRVDASVVKAVVEDFGLFAFTKTDKGECFYSESLLNRMKIKDSKHIARKEAGTKGALKRWENSKNNSNAIAKPSDNNSNAIAKPNNFIASKVKKSKEKKSKVNREGEYSTPTPKQKHGMYGNVLLTSDELEKLKEEFPLDYQARIDRLSEYMESSGKKYKSHLATIRAWARKDIEQFGKGKQIKGAINTREYDFDNLEKQLLGG